MTSTISDERLHKKMWITLDECKKVLIERAFAKFIDDAIVIGMDFPLGYHIDDVMVKNGSYTGLSFLIKATGEEIENKFMAFKEQLKLELWD